MCIINKNEQLVSVLRRAHYSDFKISKITTNIIVAFSHCKKTLLDLQF